MNGRARSVGELRHRAVMTQRTQCGPAVSGATSGRYQLQSATLRLPVRRYFLPASASRSSGVSAAVTCARLMLPADLAYRPLEEANTMPAARNPAPPP